MRRIRYQVAASLDGYIAGPKGEADWIITDPDIDFRALFAQFDTLLVGRKTFEAMGGTKHKGKGSVMPGMKVLVFSRTLRQADYPQLTIVRHNVKKAVTISEGTTALFNKVEIGAVLKNPASPPSGDLRLWQFTNTAVTTNTGVHGTVTGPWTTTRFG